jgi:serine/threonine protein kinase
MKQKYKIKEVIATGGMATIYKAEQVSLSRTVIIKKLHPHLASDKELVKRFEREAKTLGKLNHKNIVEIIDYYKSKGDYLIVLEYVQGKSLKELAKELGALSLDIANFIVYEIASGLKVAHTHGILHRDIKPANIMIGNNGTVKISDFGLALSLEGADLTEPGATIGTPAYLPPELVKGEKASPRSDFYSLGVLYYEILTGKNPFQAENRFTTINKILYDKFPSLKIDNTPECRAVAKIITKMTGREPTTRYGNVDSLLKDLSSCPKASQESFTHFIANPVEIEKVQQKEEKILSGTFIYAFLIVLAIVASLITIHEKQRIAGQSNIPSILEYKETKREKTTKEDDTLWIKNDTAPKISPTIISNPQPDKKEKIIPEETGFGYLKLVVDPWAKIYIDDSFYSDTPLSKPIKLTEGEHTILLEHPNRKSFTDTVTIAHNDTILFKVTLVKIYGFLKINVKPWAEIYVDGEKKGVTPIAKPFHLTAGKHLLELKKGETNLWNEIVNIPINDTLELTINLK